MQTVDEKANSLGLDMNKSDEIQRHFREELIQLRNKTVTWAGTKLNANSMTIAMGMILTALSMCAALCVAGGIDLDSLPKLAKRAADTQRLAMKKKPDNQPNN